MNWRRLRSPSISARRLVLRRVLWSMIGTRPAARMSFLLAQCSEFAFVALGALLALGTETQVQFSTGIIVVAATMIMTPWLNALGILWSRWDSPLVPKRRD